MSDEVARLARSRKKGEMGGALLKRQAASH